MTRNTIRFTAAKLFRNPDGLLNVTPVGPDTDVIQEFHCPAESYGILDLNKLNENLWVYTHCAVNSNTGEETWYAFSSGPELHFFRTLMQVDRMGPKSAFKVLNSTPWLKILNLIVNGDVEGFKKLKGIPEKTADDIVALVFVKKEVIVKKVPVNADAVAALQSLGWAKQRATDCVGTQQSKLGTATTEELIKACLRSP